MALITKKCVLIRRLSLIEEFASRMTRIGLSLVYGDDICVKSTLLIAFYPIALLRLSWGN